MKDTRNLHQRLQEYADCYLEGDPQRELKEICKKGIEGDATQDLTEVALKYLSLALLLGVEHQAESILIKRKGDVHGSCRIVGDTEVRVPKPPAGLTREMIGIVRCITDVEKDNGKATLIFGLRNDQLELSVDVKRADGAEELVLGLPQIRAR